MKETIVFDINETVLNLDSLKPKFKRVFGDEEIQMLWFSMLLHTSTVSIVTGVKSDFATLAKLTLETVASRLGKKLKTEDAKDILSTFSNLKPHDDITETLMTLRAAGFQTVAFSNSSLSLVSSQIDNAGLTEYFDHIISVEEAGTFKPDPAAYAYLGNKLGLPMNSMRLIATHDWDTLGALNAGMKAAYIDRLNWPYNPMYKKPDISGTTMTEVVNAIITQ
ncbi:haloacid dehalogenase type II [Photobacterium rosenbergii]|uniref:(S)-2-haloacid dehalogenase n=1 Tax=Photobacterium rosenbergii TaxID=294936 RepID=A0A2T3NJT7_9GAMM|nr:haloacid dehalogenase type II [Photobacterium rosenbergii]PSW15784.1 haloacid dehalogenase type II [Photobacterium rosenbergii]